MAEDLKFCLVWETERPYLNNPRLSSDFLMFGEEWYLGLSLSNSRQYTSEYECSFWLHRSKGAKDLETAITVSWNVITEKMTFGDASYAVQHTRNLAWNHGVRKDELNPCENSGNWKVFIHLRSAKPFSLQIDDVAVHLSTVKNKDSSSTSVDRCIQASPEIPQDIETLSSDISTLLQDEIFPDFRLKCGERIFPVHRSVLSARSEVFRAMFRNKMLENETGSADIQDLEVPVLESLLKFIYSGKLEGVSEDTISKTYEAADKYAVHCLKEACSYWLKRNVTEENCISTLNVADSHSDSDLKAFVMSFIIGNPRVMKTSDWLIFSKQRHELANEVLQTYVSSTIQ